MKFPRRITTSTYFWHMAQYYESGGKRQFAATMLRYMCAVFCLRAQVRRELIILCTNLTVRLIIVSTLEITLSSHQHLGGFNMTPFINIPKNEARLDLMDRGLVVFFGSLNCKFLTFSD